MILKVKRHNRIDTFNQFSLQLNYDAIASSFSFVIYFDPEYNEHQRLFQPGHFHEVDIEHNGELLIRGFMVNHSFTTSSTKALSKIDCYSLPGVLEDCEIPTDLYPLQFDGLTLREIANKLVRPFKLKVQVDPSVSSRVNSVYDVSTANEGQTIKSYLGSLASQKDVVLSHTPDGKLLFTEAKTAQDPIMDFSNNTPIISKSISFGGQKMHSHITVQKEADDEGGNAGESTIQNPFVPFVYRPTVRSQNSGNDVDTSEAARNELAKELKNIKLTLKIAQWEINGKIIKPNNIITIQDPELYLYERERFFIESVQLNGNEKETTATLTCVLPEVYNKRTPRYIFKPPDDHD